MLSREDNEKISRTGPGTPMGALFRRFWLPVLSSSDLGAPDGAPVRLRILGENLVAFRDTNGDVGIIDAACPHRRAKLFWGRNEDCGLRCAYHGWKFDVNGQCVDMPSEPATSRFKTQVKIKSYPAKDKGGLIWVYMGPADKQPELPHFEWMDVPDNQRSTRTSFQDSNWLQSLEGDIDTAHVSFLHRWLDPEAGPSPAPQMHENYRHFITDDTAPKLTLRDTPYGFVYGGRRTVGDESYYWRLSHWIAPCGASVPGNQYRPLRFLVPIDDEHAMSVGVSWHETNNLGESNPLRGGSEPLEALVLPDGYVIDVHLPKKTRYNDFEIDRELQRTTTFTGITGGPQDQDRAMTETMEAILDRTDEHLGTTDIAIVSVRRKLLNLAEDLEAGIEPEMASYSDVIRTRGLDIKTNHAEFDDVLVELSDDLVGRA